MFTIADQDAAIAHYTQKLGWELRADVPFGDEGANRWVEVAPPGSTARLALNAPMGDWGPAAARSESRRRTSARSTSACRRSTLSRPAR